MKLFTHKTIGFVVLFFISTASFSQISVSPIKPDIAKESKAITYSYILSGISTASDATDLITLFKSKSGIIDAGVDLPAHKLTVYAAQNLLESDILEIIKFSEKTILNDPDEIIKYYPY